MSIKGHRRRGGVLGAEYSCGLPLRYHPVGDVVNVVTSKVPPAYFLPAYCLSMLALIQCPIPTSYHTPARSATCLLPTCLLSFYGHLFSAKYLLRTTLLPICPMGPMGHFLSCSQSQLQRRQFRPALLLEKLSGQKPASQLVRLYATRSLPLVAQGI